jgi:hypothetical protein
VKVFLEGKEERLLPHSNVVTKVKIIEAQDSVGISSTHEAYF